MSNKTLSVSESDLTHILASLDQDFSEVDLELISAFFLKSYNLTFSVEVLRTACQVSKDLLLVDHWLKAIENNQLDITLDLASRLRSSDRQSREREVSLLVLLGKSPEAKKAIKAYCLDFRVKPNDLLLKIFSRHICMGLLRKLPEEFSIVIARSTFYENCFDSTAVNDAIRWLCENQKDSEEGRIASYFRDAETELLTGKVTSALSCWYVREFSEVSTKMSFILGLMQKRKIQKSKLNPYFLLVHIYSLSRESLSDAKKALLQYKNVLGDSILVKTLEIYLDLSSNNLKRAGKNLDGLQFYHKNFQSDTFFLLLCRFWCNGQLSGRELERLKVLLEDYSSSENGLMKFEIQSLYKEVIGAGDLIEDQLLFKHKPMATFLKNDQSIFDILAESELKEKTERRVIWLVSIEPSGVNSEGWVEIEPAIQEKGKSGTWKSPDLLPWKEFSDKSIRDLLSTSDRKVVRLLRDSKETLGLDFTLPVNDALRVLCNSENVFLHDDFQQKVNFDEINPVVTYYKDSYQQYFKWKYPLSPGALHVEEVDDHVYEVCILDPKLLRLREKSLSALNVNNSKSEIQKFVELLPDNLLIEGDETFKESSVSSKMTDIIARVLPSNNHLYKIQLLASSSGMTVIPGEGYRVMSIKKAGEELVWKRDKDLEKQRVNHICLQAELDFEECILPYEWEMSDPEILLTALESLHGNKDVILQWPRGGRIKVSSSTSGSISVNSAEKRDWFRIDGEISFDKKSIKLSEILKSFNRNSRFIEMGKNEFLALSKELHSGLSDIIELTDQRDECLELHAALADSLSSRLDGLPVDVEEEFIFRECVTSMIHSKSLEVNIPTGFNADLRPYQLEGFKWMSRLVSTGVGACLADDMGLGKTIQTLCLLLNQKDTGPSLIVAPTSLCHNWMTEAEKFTPKLKVIAYRGKEREGLLTKLSTGDVLVLSYGLLLQDIDFIKEVNWNVAVLDEAQLVKNSGTQRSKAIKILQARCRVALSGTPVENHVGELWNLFDWLNPGFLGSRAYFQNEYALPIEKNIPGKMEKLKTKVKPFILRRLKKDVLKDLPDSQETILYIDLNGKEREIYNASKYLVAKKLNKSKKEKRGGQNKIEILAEISRLRKITANFELSEVYNESSSKTEAVLSKVEELYEAGHQALLFSQFTSHLDIIEDLFKERGFTYSRLDGTMPAKKRSKSVDDFNSGKCRLMLISLKAGGFGLNLTSADFVMHLDPWWNPAVEEQASARAIRIGQFKKVNVLRFISAGTIEEEIVKMHAHKKDITEDLLKGTSKASRLSVEDLINLLK